MWNARQGGVAVLARVGHPLRSVAPSSPLSSELWDSGRWFYAEVAYWDGGRTLHLFSLYGVSGDGSTEVNNRNDALLLQAINAATELGAVPVLLCGDFNILSNRSTSLMKATSTWHWIDVMATFDSLEGVEPPDTCFARPNCPGSRLDYVLANVVAASALKRAWLLRHTALPTHLPIGVELDLAAFSACAVKLVRPLPFPVVGGGSSASLSSVVIAERAWAPADQRWVHALATGNTETLWELFNNAAERFLLEITTGKRTKASGQYLGRGALNEPRPAPAVAPQRAEVLGAASRSQLRVAKLLRKLEELNRSAYGRTPVFHILHLRQNIAHECGRLLDEGLAWTLPLSRAAKAMPSRAELDVAIAELRNVLAQAEDAQRRSRQQRWKSWVEESFHHEPGRMFRYLSGEYSPPMVMLRRADGTSTADPAEMDNILRVAWDPIFRMYSAIAEPEWAPFADRFGHYIRPAPMTLSDLTAADLRRALGRQGSHSAAGVEGWRVSELKELPDFLLGKLADLFNVIERTGQWPASLERALVSLIPKGDGNEPLQLRPITVTSAIYRLWASARLRDAMAWQEGWIHPGQHGFRPVHGTLDVYWAAALRVEEALLTGRPLVGLLLDYAKCFDRLPHAVMFRLASASGADERLLRPLRRMYSALRRRFKLAGGVGQPFGTTNGLLQGCPLSVVLLNLLVSVWARAVTGETDAEVDAYADDTGVAGERPAVETAAAITLDYCRTTGQALNVKKCEAYMVNAPSTSPDIYIDGTKVPRVTATRCLGAHLCFNGAMEGEPLHLTKRWDLCQR
jgi:hypothetical protein